MGNKQVKLGLRVDKKNFCAGTLATGRVYLSVAQEHHADALHLVLIGEEVSTIAHYEHNDHHSRQNREIERSSSTLVHMDVPLTHFPSSHVPPGQYEYPFEWELPSNLKSSMHCAKADSHCEIQYNLTAYLHRNGAFGEPEHVSTQSICVEAQPTPVQVNTGVVMNPEVFRMKSCCWDQGKVSLGFDADKTVASPDSVMIVGISGANESQVVVECLRAQLVETVSWSANGRTEEVTQTLAEAKISTSNLPRWQPASYSPNQQFLDSLGQTRVVTQLLVPHYARDTYTGGLIQVRHSLIISAVTQPCITTPESAILFRVQRKTAEVMAEAPINATMLSSVPEFMPDPEFVEADLLPDDWRPQEAQMVRKF
jgi:Arrestin (or S-antigen), N-terminal domain